MAVSTAGVVFCSGRYRRNGWIFVFEVLGVGMEVFIILPVLAAISRLLVLFVDHAKKLIDKAFDEVFDL